MTHGRILIFILALALLPLLAACGGGAAPVATPMNTPLPTDTAAGPLATSPADDPMPATATDMPAATVPVSTALPTTEPLSAVEEAIMAANERRYDDANQLLDVSALAQDPGPEAVIDYWDWLTSEQRVENVEIEVRQTAGERMNLFIRLQNFNYPQHSTSFWIEWQMDRWVATET